MENENVPIDLQVKLCGYPIFVVAPARKTDMLRHRFNRIVEQYANRVYDAVGGRAIVEPLDIEPPDTDSVPLG
jgi:hypothetical protein